MRAHDTLSKARYTGQSDIDDITQHAPPSGVEAHARGQSARLPLSGQLRQVRAVSPRPRRHRAHHDRGPLTAHCLLRETLAELSTGLCDPTSPCKLIWASFAVTAEGQGEHFSPVSLLSGPTVRHARTTAAADRQPSPTTCSTPCSNTAWTAGLSSIQSDLAIPSDTSKGPGTGPPWTASAGRSPSTPNARRALKPSSGPTSAARLQPRLARQRE